MHANDTQNNDVAALVAACRKALWQRRLMTTSGWWLLAPAALLAALAVVHRAALSLNPAWTLPFAAAVVLAIGISRIAATRPAIPQVLLEADRVAGTDMLMASAWSLSNNASARAEWSARQVLRAAQQAARAARARLDTRFASSPDRLTRIAAVILAGALLVLALPGKPREIAIAGASPTTLVAVAPPAVANVPGEWAKPPDKGTTQPSQAADRTKAGQRQQAMDGAQQANANTGNSANARGAHGGDTPAKPGARAPAAPAPAAGAAGRVEHVDIRRRGARTAVATTDPGGVSPDDRGASAAASAASAASLPAPALNASPAMRHFLFNWQQRLETQQ